ncbi:ring-finger-containing ubiquitin ligase [Stylonychia lemnae]|uniref:Ring-finger-containing ubiquitin ligase n=1 Tax=Stylonychia lemnae TaxID=5949 RepID=A0A078ANU8_STYLE|nr:ring-finger-containing ubiquitin ligase [Stylonychia lemnae]|eukprot:CDW84030.1 ring-finger-containing ubiquitin ligase [Stylonychia lemnae]
MESGLLDDRKQPDQQNNRTSFNSSYSLEIQMDRNDSQANSSINYSQDIQNAFTQWIIEQRDENLKFIRFHIVGLTLIQIIVWFQEPLNSYKISKIDKYLGTALSMNRVIKELKKIAILELMIEIISVSWIIYGEMIFYSENNTCNWENRHSSSYIMMFLLLTFGMILIFKWVLKILETTCNIQDDNPSFTTMITPIQPEIFIISTSLNNRRMNIGMRRNLQGIIKTFFKLKKTTPSLLSTNELQCAICLDDLNCENLADNSLKALSLPCDPFRRHAFHEKCLQSWLKFKEECPLCKKQIIPHKVLKREMRNPESVRFEHFSP